MKCDQCGLSLEESQINHFQGKVLCEDCCFDLMNSPKACDPLAVSSALTVRKQLGQTGTDGLTELQKQIYNTVSERGKIGREELTSRLNLTPERWNASLLFCVIANCERSKKATSFISQNIILT